MKKLFVLVLVFVGLFSSIQLAKANVQPKLKAGDVLSVQVNSLNGGSRLFKENDGYEEVIIDKVVRWINTSSPSEGATELNLNNPPTVSMLKMKMRNGDVAVIEPAYNCISENQTKDMYGSRW